MSVGEEEVEEVAFPVQGWRRGLLHKSWEEEEGDEEEEKKAEASFGSWWNPIHS